MEIACDWLVDPGQHISPLPQLTLQLVAMMVGGTSGVDTCIQTTNNHYFERSIAASCAGMSSCCWPREASIASTRSRSRATAARSRNPSTRTTGSCGSRFVSSGRTRCDDRGGRGLRSASSAPWADAPCAKAARPLRPATTVEGQWPFRRVDARRRVASPR